MRKASIEDHKEMGRILKEAEAAIHHVLEEDRRLCILRAKQTDQLLSAWGKIGQVKCWCEDQMFVDHPEITDQEGFHIYY